MKILVSKDRKGDQWQNPACYQELHLGSGISKLYIFSYSALAWIKMTTCFSSSWKTQRRWKTQGRKGRSEGPRPVTGTQWATEQHVLRHAVMCFPGCSVVRHLPARAGDPGPGRSHTPQATKPMHHICWARAFRQEMPSQEKARVQPKINF